MEAGAGEGLNVNSSSNSNNSSNDRSVRQPEAGKHILTATAVLGPTGDRRCKSAAAGVTCKLSKQQVRKSSSSTTSTCSRQWDYSLTVSVLLWRAVLWFWLQRFFSATLQNFATQSLLMAVGVGARKALAASAAINWMLKDGMNRLVRMGVATQFGDSFDSDLKVRGYLGHTAFGAVGGGSLQRALHALAYAHMHAGTLKQLQ